jgi:hypothetical protein
MNYYMDIDPYPMIRQRNEEMLQKVRALRLGEWLRSNRGSRGSRLVALIRRSAHPLLHRVGLAR